MNCEPSEVTLRTLLPGAAFECVLTHTTGIRGTVVQHLAGSTIVDVGKREHWCYDAPVVPHPEVTDFNSWTNSNQKGETKMAKTNGTKKAANVRTVALYAIGKKDPLPKYLDEKNAAYSALMYRAIKAAKTPISFLDAYDKIKRSVANKTEGKTPKNTISVILQKMVKDGMIARTEVKREAKAVAA